MKEFDLAGCKLAAVPFRAGAQQVIDSNYFQPLEMFAQSKGKAASDKPTNARYEQFHAMTPAASGAA